MWVTRRDVHVDRIAYSWLTRRFIDADAIIRLFGREEATGITSLIAGVAMAYQSDEQRTVQGAPVVDGLWSECRRRRNATRVSPPSSLLPFGKSRGLQDDWSPIAPGQRQHHGHYPWQHEQNSGRPWVMCISQPI
nr:chromate resistance protein ChrB domain-containing protein [Mesorhizobium sp. WSM3626]